MKPTVFFSSTAVLKVVGKLIFVFLILAAVFMTPTVWLRLILAGADRSLADRLELVARVLMYGSPGDGGIMIRGRPSFVVLGVDGVGRSVCFSDAGGVVQRLRLFVLAQSRSGRNKPKAGLTPWLAFVVFD